MSNRLSHSGLKPSDFSDQPVTYVRVPLPANTVFSSSFRLMAMFMAWRTGFLVQGTSALNAGSLGKRYMPPRYTVIQSTGYVDEKIFMPFLSASFCSSRGRSAMWASPESSMASRVDSSRASRNSSSLNGGFSRFQWLSTRSKVMFRAGCRLT